MRLSYQELETKVILSGNPNGYRRQGESYNDWHGRMIASGVCLRCIAGEHTIRRWGGDWHPLDDGYALASCAADIARMMKPDAIMGAPSLDLAGLLGGNIAQPECERCGMFTPADKKCRCDINDASEAIRRATTKT